jgi:hypothetical protein
VEAPSVPLPPPSPAPAPERGLRAGSRVGGVRAWVRMSWLLASTGSEQRVSEWLTPGAAVRVERAEVGAEIPVAPAKAKELRLQPDTPSPFLSGIHVCPRVAAELADEQRVAVFLRPRCCAGEVIMYRLPAGVIAPGPA